MTTATFIPKIYVENGESTNEDTFLHHIAVCEYVNCYSKSDTGGTERNNGL
jgi:hypothetical protein